MLTRTAEKYPGQNLSQLLYIYMKRCKMNFNWQLITYGKFDFKAWDQNSPIYRQAKMAGCDFTHKEADLMAKQLEIKISNKYEEWSCILNIAIAWNYYPNDN